MIGRLIEFLSSETWDGHAKWSAGWNVRKDIARNNLILRSKYLAKKRFAQKTKTIIENGLVLVIFLNVIAEKFMLLWNAFPAFHLYKQANWMCNNICGVSPDV